MLRTIDRNFKKIIILLGTFSFYQQILYDVELYFFLWIQGHCLVLKGTVFG